MVVDKAADKQEGHDGDDGATSDGADIGVATAIAVAFGIPCNQACTTGEMYNAHCDYPCPEVITKNDSLSARLSSCFFSSFSWQLGLSTAGNPKHIRAVSVLRSRPYIDRK